MDTPRPTAASAGAILANRYLLGEELGQGGMGAVYAAVDLRTGGRVAIKFVQPHRLRSPIATQRLRREAQLAAALNSPRVVRIIDLDTDAATGAAFLVQEFVPGPTLAERLERDGPLPPDEALAVCGEVARALEAAHAAGIVHRDLKPGNIKLVEGQVKVLDFGLARGADDPRITAAGAFVGTPAYSAPELVAGVEDADIRADVYALGVTLYELLTGELPFDGPTPFAVMQRHVAEPPPPLPPHLPAALQAVVTRCMAKRPEDRYQTPADLVAVVEAARRALTAPQEPPSRQSKATMTRSYAGRAPAPPAPQPRSSPGTPPHNLPAPLTSFVGREGELAEVTRLLGTTRLLTLTGTGGVGKTRLALEAAADARWAYADGVWLVELAPLADPTLVVQAAAAALGVREQPGRPLLDTLAAALAPKGALLLLDNCEHVAAACAALVTALLRGCPRLAVLATSREALHVAGETVWRVPSLALPAVRADARTTGDWLAGAEQAEAVRLFCERARAARPSFELTADNAAAVVQVCRALDGIPLALELAAARVKVLAVEQIAERLADRFRLLTGGDRSALPRQQTLRALIDWSHDLLSPQEQVLFRRLSVFAGSLPLEAAEAICADDGPPAAAAVPLDEMLDLLTALVDKSLLVAEERGGAMRYHLLETLRQYGAEKQAANPDAGIIAGRHRDWYLAMAERAEPELEGKGQQAWLDRLETEHDNLRTALAWSLNGGGPEAGLRMAGALWMFWAMRGYLSEGRRWLEGALEAAAGAAPRWRVKALNGAGSLAFRQGDVERAAALHDACMNLSRDTDDRRGMALALANLGYLAHGRGDLARAVGLFEEALTLLRALGDRRGIAVCLNSLGLAVAYRGDYARATALVEESVALRRELGDTQSVAVALNNLGTFAEKQGDFDRAAVLHEQSLALRRELGDRQGMAQSLGNLGLVAERQGDYARAEALFTECLASFRELGDRRGAGTALASMGQLAARRGEQGRAGERLREALRLRHALGERPGVATCLEGLAGVALAQGEPERAARLVGAAAALREALGTPLSPADRAVQDAIVDSAKSIAGDEAFTTAEAAGRLLPLDEAVAYALREPVRA